MNHQELLEQELLDRVAELRDENDRLRDVLWQIARDDPEGWAGQKARNALVRKEVPDA